MKKENIFIKIKNCIYDMKSILKYSKEGLSKAIIYIILLNVFLGLITGIVYAINVDNAISEFRDALSEDKYKFEIKNGKLNIKSDNIKKDFNGITIYIDDSYTLAEKDKAKENIKYSNEYVLVLKDGIMLNIVDYNLIGYNFNYTDLLSGNLNNQDIISKLNLVYILIIPICIIYVIFSSIIDCLIVCVLAALISKICVSLMGESKKFEELYTLSLYSATLPLIMFVTIPSIISQVTLLIGLMIGTVIYVVLVSRFEKKEELS